MVIRNYKKKERENQKNLKTKGEIDSVISPLTLCDKNGKCLTLVTQKSLKQIGLLTSPH
jgi:hypothetical protein